MTDYQRWMKEVSKILVQEGWAVHLNGHYKLKSPKGPLVIASYSPSCSRAYKNVARDLKRAGVTINFKP
jgi:hypothetical protein